MWLFGFISLGLNGFVDLRINIILYLMLKLEKKNAIRTFTVFTCYNKEKQQFSGIFFLRAFSSSELINLSFFQNRKSTASEPVTSQVWENVRKTRDSHFLRFSSLKAPERWTACQLLFLCVTISPWKRPFGLSSDVVNLAFIAFAAASVWSHCEAKIKPEQCRISAEMGHY